MTDKENYAVESIRYHECSKNPHIGHMLVPGRVEDCPKEWTTTYYKSYPRFPQISLPQSDFRSNLLSFLNRKSQWSKKSNPLSPNDYGALLSYSAGIIRPEDTSLDGRHFRAAPSAGMRYPIETYVVIFHGDKTIAHGLYHYDVKGHALTTLWKRSFSQREIHELARAPWIDKATALIVYTTVFWRTQIKYGERGYRYILLEAGHIAQNVQLVAGALGVQSCPLGGTNDGKVEELIDIDGVNESLVYALAIGR